MGRGEKKDTSMNNEQAIEKMKEVIEFVKSLPDDFMEYIVSLPSHKHDYIHMGHEHFVRCFPNFSVNGYNGNYIHLKSSISNTDVVCLYPIKKYIEQFGAERLP